ncbi:MAG: hypothetical protein Q9173_004946 [Seirophora scorigena]
MINQCRATWRQLPLQTKREIERNSMTTVTIGLCLYDRARCNRLLGEPTWYEKVVDFGDQKLQGASDAKRKVHGVPVTEIQSSRRSAVRRARVASLLAFPSISLTGLLTITSTSLTGPSIIRSKSDQLTHRSHVHAEARDGGDEREFE